MVIRALPLSDIKYKGANRTGESKLFIFSQELALLQKIT